MYHSIRKTIALSIFSCLSLFASAQKTFVGVFGGPQYTTAAYKVNDASNDVSGKWGGQAGVLFRVPFENRLFFVPAVFYSLKGFDAALTQRSFPPGAEFKATELRVHSLDLATLLQYNFSEEPGHFFFRGGGALETAFKGTERLTREDNSALARDLKFSFGDYGRFTFSLLAHAGYETESGFFIFGQYTHGVGNMNNADNGPRILHRAVGISVGKYLRRN